MTKRIGKGIHKKVNEMDVALAVRKLWRAKDVAIALGIGQRLAERLMKTNAIRSTMFGRCRVTTPQYVDNYIEEQLF